MYTWLVYLMYMNKVLTADLYSFYPRPRSVWILGLRSPSTWMANEWHSAFNVSQDTFGMLGPRARHVFCMLRKSLLCEKARGLGNLRIVGLHDRWETEIEPSLPKDKLHTPWPYHQQSYTLSRWVRRDPSIYAHKQLIGPPLKQKGCGAPGWLS